MFSRIMVPVDLAHSEQLGKALDIAADLARRHGAELHIVGVTESAPTEIAPNPEAYSEKLKLFASSCSEKLGIAVFPHSEIGHDLAADLNHVPRHVADTIGTGLIAMASHIPDFVEHFVASNAG